MLGTILAIEVKTGEGNTYFSEVRDYCYAFFIENGLLMRPLGNVIFLNPPYCTTNQQLQNALLKIRELLDTIQHNTSF
jgi:adenosylmethionine-8-amino-7-oxononanoate aminotransferase